ncbi:hypothetical protein T265_10822 [Opisthorchis viverrini]|uniref:Uncharacterized protein n=1 Tax=Opisthorchis viverrini TaxID=6198 RepID=A0A074Z0Z6_OPIVI|nr:hypothetical protein T265_10822 [Opisthorchis viverrini]KER20691.1 hypothetical protein T265_10822 [Opisthorchis viverrini]
MAHSCICGPCRAGFLQVHPDSEKKESTMPDTLVLSVFDGDEAGSKKFHETIGLIQCRYNETRTKIAGLQCWRDYTLELNSGLDKWDSEVHFVYPSKILQYEGPQHQSKPEPAADIADWEIPQWQWYLQELNEKLFNKEDNLHL